MRTFVQSRKDCACRVRLGGQGRTAVPNMNLSKWGDRAFLNMNFAGGSCRQIRDDGNELLLVGSEEAHRYRRLDNGRFEYDVILEEQPRRPFVVLELRYPAGLEFYRQRRLEPGDRTGVVRSPFVEGSYAVYWRQRNGRFKTGKFCHIFRPRLIDSAGAWCWGELELQGCELVIRLPERWLKRARYPVVVDPIIGTDSIGASTLDGSGDPVEYMGQVVVNRYYAPNDLGGPCTGFLYHRAGVESDDGWPVVYEDLGGVPGNKRSVEEGWIRADRDVGWYGAAFQIPTVIAASQYVWFGLAAGWITPCFDDGGELKIMDGFDGHEVEYIPNTFVENSSESRILSMYFSYNLAQDYEATLLETEGEYELLGRSVQRRRSVSAGHVSIDAVAQRKLLFVRGILGGTSIHDCCQRTVELARSLIEELHPAGLSSRLGEFVRLVASEGGALDTVRRTLHIVKRILVSLRLWDYITNRRVVTFETVTVLSRVTTELTLTSRI